MATIEINIDDYLSESEKKEYAIEAFKEAVKHTIFNGKQGVAADSEIQRVIGNISHHIVFKAVQEHIPNVEQLIKAKTLDILQSDSLRYQVFKRKDLWEAEESLAITYMLSTIKENKDMFQQKIKSQLENYDATDDIKKELANTFCDMANTLDKLAALFVKE